MIKTAEEIREAYRKIYKNLEPHYRMPMSPEFLLPSTAELIDAIQRHSVKGMQYRDNIADCEKFAWFLVWGIQKERADDQFNEGITWAVGWASGVQIDLMGSTSHTMATAVTSDRGVVIINPRNDAVLAPNPDEFDVYLFVM